MKKSLFLILIPFFISACSGGKNRTNVEPVQDMMDQISAKAQDWDPKQGGKGTQMLPPENTIPKGFKPYPYGNNAVEAGRKLKNPLRGDFSPQVMELGKANYDIYCAVCHGVTGAGDGTVAGKMAIKPPSLLTKKVRNYPDGRIYHIIRKGQGVMGSYAGQIYREKDRWAVVNYIKSLQKEAK